MNDTTKTERVTPCAPDIEKGILGLCITQPKYIHHCTKKGITKDYFFPPIHQCFWEFLKERAIENKPFDMASLSQAAIDAKVIEPIMGKDFLAEIIQKASPPFAVDEHIKILNEKYIRREVIKRSSLASELAYDESSPPTKAVDTLAFSQELREKRASITLADTLNLEVWPSIDTRNKEHTHITGVKTGFPTLDDALGGLQGGTVTILGARPSTGKTALSLNIIKAVAENIKQTHPGHKVVYLTAEMPPRKLAERMLNATSGVYVNDAVKQENGISQEQAKRLGQSRRYLASLPILFYNVAGMPVDDIAAILRYEHLHSGEPVGCVCLDYLQLIDASSGKKYASRDAEVGNVSRVLHMLATELDIPILALAQLNRKAAAKCPSMAELRESGSIEQDADAILLLHRPEPEQEENCEEIEKNLTFSDALLNIAKNRDGKTAEIKLFWQPEYQLFRERKQNE